MTEARMTKGLWALSWPILLSFAMTLSLPVTDTWFLSHHSDEAAAGVGAMLPVFSLLAAVFASLGQAGCAVAGQLLGARRNREVPATYGSLLLLNGGLGLLASGLALASRTLLPESLGLTGAPLAHARSYFGWIGSTLVIGALQHTLTNIANSRGATQWTLAQAAAANAVNVVLNFLLMDGPWGSFGVVGVAWATIAARTTAVLLLGYAVLSRLKLRIVFHRRWSLLRNSLRPIVRIGAPSALEPLAFEGSRIVLMMMIITMGPAALAARVYTFNVTLLSVIWSLSLGIGTQILIAYRVGEGRSDIAHAQLLSSLRLATLGSLVIILLLNIFREPIIGSFTADAEVRELTKPLFLLAFVLELGRAGNVVTGGALRSSGDARFAGVVGSVLMWVVAIPLSYLFGVQLGLGVVGVWLAMAIDECVRAGMNLWRWQTGTWRQRSVVDAAN